MMDSHLSGLIDDYFVETSAVAAGSRATRYREYLTIASEIDLDEMQFSNEKHLTNNLGEHLVLVSYQPKNMEQGKVFSMKTELEFLKLEFSEGKDYESNDRLEMNISCSGYPEDVTYHYISRKIDDLSDIETTRNDKPIELPEYRYYYSKNGEKGEELDGEVMVFGLWNAYIHNILRGIFTLPHVQDSRVRTVQDQYSSSMQAINDQVIEKENFSFRIDEIRSHNNILSVQLK
jgi:hypothetical protein